MYSFLLVTRGYKDVYLDRTSGYANAINLDEYTHIEVVYIGIKRIQLK